MKRTYLLGIVVLLLAGAHLAVSQRDFSNVQVKAAKVSGNVYMLEGAGGNIGISVGDDGVLMVDSQFAPLAPKIRSAIKDLGGDKITFLLNTHWHGDHTGGNPVFGPETPIVAHSNVRQRLAEGMSAPGRNTPPAPAAALPVITYDNGISFHFNGEEIKVIHVPTGHTDGDSIIHFTNANVVHMGDQFFAGRFPFVDLDSGGDVEGYAANVARAIRDLPADVKIIPGHGPLSTIDDLKTFHGMMTETTQHVSKAISAGKSLDEIKAAGLPKKWDSWGSGFINTDRWIQIVHKSLSS